MICTYHGGLARRWRVHEFDLAFLREGPIHVDLLLRDRVSLQHLLLLLVLILVTGTFNARCVYKDIRTKRTLTNELAEHVSQIFLLLPLLPVAKLLFNCFNLSPSKRVTLLYRHGLGFTRSPCLSTVRYLPFNGSSSQILHVNAFLFLERRLSWRVGKYGSRLNLPHMHDGVVVTRWLCIAFIVRFKLSDHIILLACDRL